MDKEAVKNYLAIYDDTYSYNQLSHMTGYSVDALRDIYDELIESGEFNERRRAMRKMVRMGGVYRIDPITLESKYYTNVSEVKQDGYLISNVYSACRKMTSICFNYLWRYGVDVDKNHVARSVLKANPELFIPVYSIDIATKKEEHFKTIQHAVKAGYNRTMIMNVIEGKRKSHKDRVWFKDRMPEKVRSFRKV